MVQEAAVVADLPLPPEMQHLEQIFQALNAVHSFLLSAHIQVHMASCSASIAEEAASRRARVLSHIPDLRMLHLCLGLSRRGVERWSMGASCRPPGGM